jgi:dihydrofolate reductase
MLAIVVACSTNRVIGHAGELPWQLPADMRRFRELTTGRTVIMGRKTFESLPAAYRPLPNRRNLVLSSDLHYAPAGAEVFPSLESAIDACGGDGFVIGGGQVYAEALARAERVYLTDVDIVCDGDTFFPELAPADWRCVEESERMIENGRKFVFQVYERAA